MLGGGEYAHVAPAERLVPDGRDRHPTERTGLRGARLVVLSETGGDGALDEGKMKSLTGGDSVTARYCRGDFFTFRPTFKRLLLTNHLPRIRGTDHGVWRRLRIVSFRLRFGKDADKDLDPRGDFPDRLRADPRLGERLRTVEAEAILADLVEQARAFYRGNGTLDPPAEVRQAVAAYHNEQDHIGRFLDGEVRADPDALLKSSDLYAAFSAWWEQEGLGPRPPGVTKFGRVVKAKGLPHEKRGWVFFHARLRGHESVRPGTPTPAAPHPPAPARWDPVDQEEAINILRH